MTTATVTFAGLVLAQPFAARYGRWSRRQEPAVEAGSARDPRPRGTLATKGRP